MHGRSALGARPYTAGVLGVVVTVTGAAVIAAASVVVVERYARRQVREYVSGRTQELAGVAADVQFAARPLLWQSAVRSVPRVAISSGPAADGMTVRVSVTGITGNNDGSTLALVECDGFLPYERIVDFVADGNPYAPLYSVTSVRGDRRGTIRVDLRTLAGLLPLPVTVIIRPVVGTNGLELRCRRVHTVALGWPAQMVQGIADAAARRVNDALGAHGMALEELAVAERGLQFTVAGADVVVPANLTRPPFPPVSRETMYLYGLVTPLRALRRRFAPPSDSSDTPIS